MRLGTICNLYRQPATARHYYSWSLGVHFSDSGSSFGHEYKRKCPGRLGIWTTKQLPGSMVIVTRTAFRDASSVPDSPLSRELKASVRLNGTQVAGDSPLPSSPGKCER